MGGFVDERVSSMQCAAQQHHVASQLGWTCGLWHIVAYANSYHMCCTATQPTICAFFASLCTHKAFTTLMTLLSRPQQCSDTGLLSYVSQMLGLQRPASGWKQRPASGWKQLQLPPHCRHVSGCVSWLVANWHDSSIGSN